MKVARVLNNNVVLGEEDGVTYLLMGLSIGFKRKSGDILPSSAIEKMFVLSNPKSASRLRELVGFIPEEYFMFCSDAMVYIKRTLKREFSDSLYILLTDHFHASIEREKQGIVLKNALLSEVKKFYKEEYAVALHVVEMANEKFHSHLSEDEAAFITFHIVNSQIGSDSSSIQEMTRLIQEILLLVKNKYEIKYDEDKVSYSRFVTHLKYFTEKVMTNKKDDFIDEDMYNLVRTKYRREFEGAMDILKLIREKYGYVGTEMDALYLTIHIARVINE